MPNPDTAAHAARLRKMAEQMPSMGQRTRAALLAGAEALEAVEAYRRYDAFGRDNSAWVGPEAKNSAETSKRLWAEFRAALARLEGPDATPR
jgi:hypothetical protein